MTDPMENPSLEQQAQTRRQYSLMRRILFPYDGENPLSLSQGLRVVIAWILFFSPGVFIITLIAVLIAEASLQKALLAFLFTLLFGVFIFGLMGWFTVSISNRAARIQQAQKATKARGGRYGS